MAPYYCFLWHISYLWPICWKQEWKRVSLIFYNFLNCHTLLHLLVEEIFWEKHVLLVIWTYNMIDPDLWAQLMLKHERLVKAGDLSPVKCVHNLAALCHIWHSTLQISPQRFFNWYQPDSQIHLRICRFHKSLGRETWVFNTLYGVNMSF